MLQPANWTSPWQWRRRKTSQTFLFQCFQYIWRVNASHLCWCDYSQSSCRCFYNWWLWWQPRHKGSAGSCMEALYGMWGDHTWTGQEKTEWPLTFRVSPMLGNANIVEIFLTFKKNKIWSMCSRERVSYSWRGGWVTCHRLGSHLCHPPAPPTRRFERESAGKLEHQRVRFFLAPSTLLWTESLAHWLSWRQPRSGCCGSACHAGLGF